MATDLTGQQVGSTGTYFDDALRIHYQPAIRTQFPQKSVLLQNLERGDAKKIDTSGQFARITLQKALHPSVGAKPEGKPLPNKSYTRLETTDVYMKQNYGRIEITGNVMRASRDNRGSVMKSLEVETEAVTKALRNDVNRQLACGNGTGQLALSNGDPDSGWSDVYTAALDSLLGIAFTTPSSIGSEVAPTKYFVAGMEFDMGDATTYTTIDVTAATVTTVNSATGMTVSTCAGGDDNGYLMRHDAAASEIMGLRGIIDDSGHLDTLQTITRSTAGNNYWKASVVDYGSAAAPATLTEAYMQEAQTLTEKNDGEVSFVLTTYGLRDSYVTILQSDKRFVNTTELKGGFKSVDFNGTPLTPDKDCTPYTMYFVDKSTLELYESSPITWADEDGSVLSRVANYDAYEAFLYYYANLGANNCVKNACLSYVQ